MTLTSWRTCAVLPAILALLGTSACSAIRIGGVRGDTGGEDPAVTGQPTGPAGTLPRPGSTGTVRRPGTSAPGMETREICRSDPRPSGWIAVAYVESGTRCPRTSDETRPRATAAAVIARYAGQPVGTVLEVCADQALPRDWLWESGDIQDAQRCPGAAAEGRTTVRLMRRVR